MYPPTRCPLIAAMLALPFADLVFRAQEVHRVHFDPNTVQVSALLSIKTGGCPEDCAYCPQSARYDTSVGASRLMSVDAVLEAARAARAQGASRFCMGAAWRSPKDHDLDAVFKLLDRNIQPVVIAVEQRQCLTAEVL